MPSLVQRLLAHIRQHEFLHAGDRVGVAVSGGLDSVALLRLLLELRHELGIVISVVHFNHKLRGEESDADEGFVRALAAEHQLEFHGQSGDVAQLAADQHLSIEAAARQARYEFFATLLTAPAETALHKIATAHTLDDQAETIMMRVVRGTGLRGLGGIHPRLVIENEDDEAAGEIIRPLLGTRRRELESYLTEIHQSWREDSSNSSHHFTRNRMRQRVMPLLEREFNPSVAENLAELAELARAEQDYWDSEAAGWLGTVVQWAEPEWARSKAAAGSALNSLVQISSAAAPPEIETTTAVTATISRPWLVSEPVAVQRRLIKTVAEQAGIPLEFKHVEEILRFAADAGPSGKELSLPLGWKLLREAESVVFAPPAPEEYEHPRDYEHPFPIPGSVSLPDLGIVVEAIVVENAGEWAAQFPGALLTPEIGGSSLILRNWRPGDRFWPAHTSAPKKIKELLQERHIPLPQRKLWPVLARGEEIVWLRGFPVPAALKAGPSGPAVLVREAHLADDTGI